MILQAISAYFNFCGYQRPRANCEIYRNRLGIEPWIYEAVLPGHVPLEGARRSIVVEARQQMWQKERLLNLAIEDIGTSVDETVVLWLDADIVFHDQTWIYQVERVAKRYPVFQLYSYVDMLAADGGITSRLPSCLSRRSSGGAGHPGFAWGARLSFLRDIGGLYDRNVIGTGDFAMLVGFTHTLSNARVGEQFESRKPDWAAWCERVFRAARGWVGVVPGGISHLYHGSLVDRQYREKESILNTHQYDPRTDVRIGSNGLLTWCSDKPELEAQVVASFHARREDA